MNFNRIFYYIILTISEFLISAFFIFIIIRYSYNTQGSDGNGYREFLYWLMRILIVVLNMIIAFRLVPNASKRYKLLFGLFSGIGYIVYSSFYHEIFTFMDISIGKSGMIMLFFTEYLVQIICLELVIRLKNYKNY